MVEEDVFKLLTDWTPKHLNYEKIKLERFESNCIKNDVAPKIFIPQFYPPDN